MTPWRGQARLLIHRDAGADLAEIWKNAPRAGAKIGAFLQEAKASPEIMGNLSVHGYALSHIDDYEVKKWVAQQKQGRNLWRIRLWDLERAKLFYRIIYAFDPPLTYYVLGITTHDYRDRQGFNYRNEDQFTKRIVAVYDSLIER